MTYRFTTLRSVAALAAFGAAHTLFAAAPALPNDPVTSPSIFKMSTNVADPTRDVRYQSDSVSSSVDTDETFTPSTSLDARLAGVAGMRASLRQGAARMGGRGIRTGFTMPMDPAKLHSLRARV